MDNNHDNYVDCGQFHSGNCIGCGHRNSKCDIPENSPLGAKLYQRYGVETQKKWASKNRKELKMIMGEC